VSVVVKQHKQSSDTTIERLLGKNESGTTEEYRIAV
jgi:hypothetical protein